MGMTEQKKLQLRIKGEIRSYNCTVCQDCARAMSSKIMGFIKEAGYESPEEVNRGKEQVREAFRFPKIGRK